MRAIGCRTLAVVVSLALCAVPAHANSYLEGDQTGASIASAASSNISVSEFGGAAVSQYTISVPPGRMGMQPDLTLTYNSGSRRSTLLGKSWDFAFPTITRSTRGGQPKFSAADKFVLKINGSSYDLIPTCDPTVRNAACAPSFYEFRTEVETFMRIRMYVAAPALSYWQLEDGKGKTFLFGQDEGTGVPAQYGDNTYSVNRITDSHGNYMVVKWQVDGGFLYPKRIEYTGFSGTPAMAPTNSVDFTYQSRTDVTQTRLGVKPGLAISEMKLRLLSVVTKAGNQTAGTTTFGYSNASLLNNTGPSVLTQIQRFDAAGGSSLPAITYAYTGDTNRTFSAQQYVLPNYFSKKICTGSWPYRKMDDYGWQIADINGDGLTDLLHSRSACVGGITQEVFLNQNGNWVRPTGTDWKIPTGLFFIREANCSSGADDLDDGVRLIDYDNDGLTDFVRAYFANDTTKTVTYCVAHNNGHGWDACTTSGWKVPAGFVRYGDNRARDEGVRVGDVNGDGLVDLVRSWDYGVPYQQTQQRTVYLNMMRDPVAPSNAWVSQGTTWKVPASFVQRVAQHGSVSASTVDSGGRLVDLNGDGLADILKSVKWATDPARYEIYINKGGPDASGNVWELRTDWVVPELFITVTITGTDNDSDDYGVRFADMNGDGLIDIIRASHWDNGNTVHKVYLHNGGVGWTYDPAYDPLIVAHFIEHKSGGEDYPDGLRVADVNGDGIADQMGPILKDSSCTGYSSLTPLLSNDIYSDLLQSSANGVGGTTTLKYASSASFPAAVRTGGGGLMDFNLPVLTETTVSDGQAGATHNYTTRYSYKEPRYNYPRREFRGFKYVRTSLPGGRAYREQQFVQDTPGLAASPLAGTIERSALRKVGTGADGPIFTLLVNSFNQTDVAEPYYHYIAGTDNYLYDWEQSPGPIDTINPATLPYKKRSRSANTYTLSSLGFVATHQAQDLGDPSITTDDLYVTEEFIYPTASYPALWRFGILKRRTSASKAAPAVTDLLSDSWTSYDNLPWGQVGVPTDATQIETWGGGSVGRNDPGNRITTMAYDTDGHINSTTDPGGHTSLMIYGVADTTRTFLDQTRIKTTSSTGGDVWHDTFFTYDPRFGSLVSMYSSGGPVIYSEADGFGRPSRTWTVAGTPSDSQQYPTTCWVYDLSMHSPPWTSVTQYRREKVGLGESCGTNGMLGSAVIYDGMGRSLQEKSETADAGYINGSAVTKTLTFDTEGRVGEMLPPFHSLDAIATFTAPLATQPRSTVTYDEAGREIGLTSPGLAGQPPRVSSSTYSGWTKIDLDFEGKQTQTDIDVRGRTVERRTYGDAASTTTTRYTYDLLGRLKTLSDTGNNISQYSYNTFSELTITQDPDSGTVVRTYNKDGRLETVHDDRTELGSTQYTYDAMHRLIRVDRNVGTNMNTLPTTYNYDEPSGRPAGPAPIGLLTSVSNGALSYQSFRYDLRGRPSSLVEQQWDSAAQTYLTYAIGEELDDLGRTTRLTYPDASAVDYLYGQDGRVSDVPGFASGARYDAGGQLLHLVYGNTLKLDNTIDPQTGWLTRSLAVVPFAAGIVLDSDMTYRLSGLLSGIVDHKWGASQTFQLDDLYRLTRATGAYGTEDYTYDTIGNLRSRKISPATTPLVFNYGDPAHPHRLTSTSDGRSYGYDVAGNMTLKDPGSIVGKMYFDYNELGLMAGAREISTAKSVGYTYNPQGTLIQRGETTPNVSTVITHYVADLYEDTGGVGKKYVYFGPLRIADWGTYNGPRYYYTSDHLGSLSVVTDEAGEIVSHTQYRPYGEIYQSDNGSASLLYAGSRRDPFTNLYNFGVRHYDPELARFMSPDPVLGNPGDPRELNPYTYALGNPTSLADVGGYLTATQIKIIGEIVHLGVTALTDGCEPCGAAASAFVTAYLTARENGASGRDAFNAGFRAGVISGVTSYATSQIGAGFKDWKNGTELPSGFQGPPSPNWATAHPLSAKALESVSETIAKGSIGIAFSGHGEGKALGETALHKAFNAYASSRKFVPNQNYWIAKITNKILHKDGELPDKYRAATWKDVEKLVDFVRARLETPAASAPDLVLLDLPAAIQQSAELVAHPATTPATPDLAAFGTYAGALTRTCLGAEAMQVLRNMVFPGATPTGSVGPVSMEGIYLGRGLVLSTASETKH